MAYTANQILHDVVNIATSGSTPVDFKIEDSQILFWIDEVGETLKSRALEKRQDISDVWIQNISCLDLIAVDKSECCEITTDCNILRTTLTIPQTIETHGRNAIIRVVKPNGIAIPEVTTSEARYTQYTKYGNKGTKWYLKNNYIYIIDDEYLESISVYGIFSRPSELAAYTSCSGSTCYSVDSAYPVSGKMASEITDMILKTKVYPFLQMPQDTSNNAANDAQQPTNKG